MKPYFRFNISIPLLLLAGACAHSPAGSDYKLVSEALRPAMDPGVPLALIVDYVAVPDVVDRPELVLRINPSQVRIVETARWQEPLRTQIANVLALDLKRLFRDSLVSTASQTTDRPIVRLAINVRAFDSMPGSAVGLSVSWSILTPDLKQVLNGKSVVLQRVDGDNYDALVDAQSRALAAVSGDMADAIMSAIRKKPPIASGRIFDARSNQQSDSETQAETFTSSRQHSMNDAKRHAVSSMALLP